MFFLCKVRAFFAKCCICVRVFGFVEFLKRFVMCLLLRLVEFDRVFFGGVASRFKDV